MFFFVIMVNFLNSNCNVFFSTICQKQCILNSRYFVYLAVKVTLISLLCHSAFKRPIAGLKIWHEMLVNWQSLSVPMKDVEEEFSA